MLNKHLCFTTSFILNTFVKDKFDIGLKLYLSPILAIFYVILSFGININLHLCQDELKSVHILQIDDRECHISNSFCCEKDNEEPSSNIPCCSHEEYQLIANDIKAPVKEDNIGSFSSDPLISYQIIFVHRIINTSEYSFTPPPSVPLYLKEHRFTYYG